MTVQHADTVTCTSRTWTILKYPCRNAYVTVKIMKKSIRRREMSCLRSVAFLLTLIGMYMDSVGIEWELI